MAYIPELGVQGTRRLVENAQQVNSTSHVVRPTETVADVAVQTGVNRAAIERANPHLQAAGGTAPGDTLTIPPRVGNEAVLYTVQTGQTVEDVAADTGVTVQHLLQENELQVDDVVYPGTQLLLPEDVAPTATDEPGPATPVEEAVADVVEAQSHVDELNRRATQGNPAAIAALATGYPEVALRQAEAHLRDTVEGEIQAEQYNLRQLPLNNRHVHEIAAGNVLGRYEGSAEGEAVLRAVVDEITADYEARQDRIDNIQETATDIIDADGDEARLAAYTDAIEAAPGDTAYQNALTAIVLREDPSALGTWFNPEFINDQAAAGALSQSEHRLAAQQFFAAYNNGHFPEHDLSFAVEYYSENGELIEGTVLDSFLIGWRSGGPFSGPTDQFEPVRQFDELNDLLDAAGSTEETRQFRQDYATYLNETYVQNPNILSNEVRNAAAAGAALIISGDASSPELAQDFLVGLHEVDPAQFTQFMDRAARASFLFSEQALITSQQAFGHGLRYDAAEVAQADPIAELVGAFGEAGADPSNSDVEELALILARAPHDQGAWTGSNDGDILSQRQNAWAQLFTGHSTDILDTLTNPSGLPTVDGANVEAGFINRAEDLGALLGFTQVSAHSDEVAGALNEYNALVRDRIANADIAETTIEESRRLGFLGAAITESVNQGFEQYRNDQEEKRALLGFIVDLAFSTVPIGGFVKGIAGDQIADFVKGRVSEGYARDFLTDALKGFSGQIISAVDGKLTDAARDHILSQVSDEEIGALITELADSNLYIQDTLFDDLPAPGYTPENDLESGRADVIDAVQTAYDIALEALTD